VEREVLVGGERVNGNEAEGMCLMDLIYIYEIEQ
jgi:hypothetical protein